MQIIAITGLPGSGKTAVSRVLEKKGYSRVRFGDITDDEIKKRGLEFNEQNEEMVRDELRKTHGMEAYAKLSVPRIEKHEKVVIDGLYSYDEYDFLKEKYGDKVVLAVVEASPEIRYGRLGSRKERSFSMEEAKSRDKSQIEKLNMQKTLDSADVRIINEGSVDELEKQADEKLLNS